MSKDTRLFPILVPPSVAERAAVGDITLGQQMTIVCAIPWSMIAPHEKQAKRNHRLGLEAIAQRGGLDAVEALAVIEGRSHYAKPFVRWLDANSRLASLLAHISELEVA